MEIIQWSANAKVSLWAAAGENFDIFWTKREDFLKKVVFQAAKLKSPVETIATLTLRGKSTSAESQSSLGWQGP